MPGLTSDDITKELHYSASRAEVLNEAFKALVLLNGGATVALLGFLQSNWNPQTPLLRVMIVGIAVFVIGLVFAVPIPLLRYWHSHLWEKEEKARKAADLAEAENKQAEAEKMKAEAESKKAERMPYWHGYIGCHFVSIVCFVFAALWILTGAWQ